jgi:hypothetical protein
MKPIKLTPFIGYQFTSIPIAFGQLMINQRTRAQFLVLGCHDRRIMQKIHQPQLAFHTVDRHIMLQGNSIIDQGNAPQLSLLPINIITTELDDIIQT